MKILVPIDFTKTSNNSAQFATKFAKKVNAEIIFLHVEHFEPPPTAQISFIEHKLEELRLSDAYEHCTKLTNQLKAEFKDVPIDFKVLTGYPIENVIEEYSAANEIDLIIIGTKGAVGITKRLFGSNAVAVLNKSTIPVITVPESSRFHTLKHIVYASDLQRFEVEIQKIIPIAKLFDASIHVFHIFSKGNAKIFNVNLEDLINKLNYKKIFLNIENATDIVQGIQDFVADIDADLLVLFHHEATFISNLLGKSFSNEIASHSPTPLLTFKI